MEASVRASEATSAAWNAHIGAYERQSGLLRAARDALTRGYDDLRREKDDLVRENGGTDVGDGDLLKINAGGRAVSVTRGTLTQIEGSRLAALFGGRSESRLLRDGDGRVFLDVNPDCFQALVDCLNERRITPPDTAVDPPDAGEENKVYLERLLRSFGMEDLLASSALREAEPRDEGESSAEEWESLTFDEFPEEVQILLQAERKTLIEAKQQLSAQRRSFREEMQELAYFIDGETKDIVWLDVSGVPMAVKRSTLGMCEDSVLAKQFNDPLWERKDASDDRLVVKDWTPEQVEAWSITIEGFPVEASTILRSNDVRGVHLLAMRREDFRDLGIKAGVLAVLVNAIEELQKSNEPGPAFIEHSSYCFGKLVDQLRVRAMQQSADSFLPEPRIKERERKRFKTVVGYYFPGESASFVLGESPMDTRILTPTHVEKIVNWLEEDDLPSNFELLYRASRDGWKSRDFHSKCDNKGSTVTVVRTTDGCIFGGFADSSWKRVGGYMPSPQAFLFSVISHRGPQPAKIAQNEVSRQEETGVFHGMSQGPSFGVGHDLHISDNPNKPDSNSYALVGSSYCGTQDQNGTRVFTNSDKFVLTELEVFRVG